MNINSNSQLWRFINRYNPWDFTYPFETGDGNICMLASGSLYRGASLQPFPISTHDETFL
jgi:hypothetical protein